MKINLKKLLRVVLPAVIFAGVFALAIQNAFASITVTPATGGTTVSADTNTTNGTATWTTLTGPTVTEGAYQDFPSSGTFILQAPSGFSFNTAATVTATTTRISGSGTCFGFSSGAAVPTASKITFTLNTRDGGSSYTQCSVKFSNIQVRPTAGTPLVDVDITDSGSASLKGITVNSTSLGALTEIAGAKNKLTITTQPAFSAVVNTDFAPDPVVALQDKYGNTVTSDNATIIAAGAVLSTQLCGGTPGSGTLSSNPASGAKVTNGAVAYTTMQYTKAESIKICFTSLGVASALSSAVSVVLPAPTVTSVNPTSGLNNASQPITTISGNNFISGATVKLTKTGQSDISCTGLAFINSKTLSNGSCPITGVAIGTWNVTVVNPDSQSGTLANGFTVNSQTTTPSLYPSSAGDFSDWLPNGTASAITATNGTDATDATYIDTSATPLISIFMPTKASVPSGNITVNSVTLYVVAKGTAPSSSFQFVVAKDSTHFIVSSSTPLTTGYQTYSHIFPTEGDGSSWTKGTDGNDEITNWSNSFGVQTTAGTPVPRVTQMYVVVNYSTNSSCKLGVALSWDGGTTWTSEKQTLNFTGTEATYKLGNSTDNWGRTTTPWAVSDFSNDNFRARVHAINSGSGCQSTDTDHLDWLRLNVSYSRSTSRAAALNAADAAKKASTTIFSIYYNSTPSDSDKSFMAELANGDYPYPPYQNGSLYNATTTTSGAPAQYASAATAPNSWSNAQYGYTTGLKNYTTSIIGSTSSYQGYTNFNFIGSYAIAPTASINNLRIDLQAKAPGLSGCSVGVEVSTDGGTTFTTSGNKIVLTSTNNRSYNIGATTIASTMWGRSFLSTDFDPGKFVVRLQDIRGGSCSGSGTLSVNSLKATISWVAIGENSDGDNFFIATTPDQMPEIFDYIGNSVCSAARPVQVISPTTATLLVITNVTNSNSGTKKPSDFTVNVTTPSQPTNSFSGSSSAISLTIYPGDYVVTENPMSGYTEILGDGCSSVAGASSTKIKAGETRTCIITNDDIPPPPPPPDLTITPVLGTWLETSTTP